MKKLLMCIISILLLANSSFAVAVTTIGQLDDLAEFSFAIMGDNNGMAAKNYDQLGDATALGMSRLEPWIKNNDAFCLAVGDHAIGTRKVWYQMNETDSFWHNHYYPSLGDNCNGTDYFYGVTADQAIWGRGWVMFKALNNFFTRNTAVDQITFRPKGTAKVYSSKSKTEPNVLVPYDDQLCDYYAKRTQGKFTIHIISVNYPDPGVLAPVSKNFLISKLNELAVNKTNYDIIVVLAQKAHWIKRAYEANWITLAERNTIMNIADLTVNGDDHIYRRENWYDANYDGTEALWMNSGAPYNTGALWGYLDVHVFDNPPRFTVQYIDVQLKTTRQLHINPVTRSSTQQALPVECVKPVMKYVNGPYVSVDWNNFPISAVTVPSVSLAVPSANVTVNAGTNLYVKVNATDPDGISQVRLYKNGVQLARAEGGAPYEWGAAGQNDPELQNLAAGSFVLTAQATDTQGTVGSTTASITVTVRSANLPPYFTSDPFSKPDATAGAAYNEPFNGKAIDPEGGTMTFSKVAGPAWMTVTSTGYAQGTPGSVDVGTNSFLVKVTDSAGLTDTATMTINVVGGAPQTVTFTSVAAEDGYLNESTETSNIGGGFNATGTAGAGLRIGDTTTKQQHKSVVSFDTSSIPDGAVIQSATLKLMRGAISGTVTNLGLIKVDIKGATGFNGSTALQNQDFEAASDATNVATMSYPTANGTLSTGGLNATGLTKLNKTGKTQLRVYFATDDNNNGTSDYLGFYPAENATVANRPVLVVTYQ